MLMCEVALGKINDLREANSEMNKAAEGFNSTRGVGQTGPDHSHSIVFPNGVGVPIGEVIQYPIPTEILKANPPVSQYAVSFNEFIVYDTSQIRMRYLVQFNNH